MPMTPEQRMAAAKRVYQEFLGQGHSPEVARTLLKEQHDLTEEQLKALLGPKPPSSAPKPQVPSKAALQTGLQSAAGVLRSLAAALGSAELDRGERAKLARDARTHASRLEALLPPTPPKEKA